MHPTLEERLHELRTDRRHGASWMARRALEALVEAIEEGEDPLESARTLASARLSLGAIAGAVGRVVAASTSPEQTIAEAEAVINGRDRAARAIAILSQPQLHGSVLTHSASATVREALLHAEPRHVICTISEPGGEGAALAEELRFEGLSVELLEDPEAVDGARRADLVFLGADTVFRDGSLVNKIGSRAIAEAAHEAGKRVVVACEVFKLAPFLPEPPPEDDFFEIVPGELVDQIITEEGAAAADDVEALIDRTPFLRQGYELLRGRRNRLRPTP